MASRQGDALRIAKMKAISEAEFDKPLGADGPTSEGAPPSAGDTAPPRENRRASGENNALLRFFLRHAVSGSSVTSTASFVTMQTGKEWGLATKVIHWSTAVLIVSNIAIGIYLGRILMFSDAGHHSRWLFMMNEHKTIGVIVLLLAPLRSAWTLSRPRPRLPDAMSEPHRIAAKVSVASLYLAMLCVPLMGLGLSTFAHAEFKFLGIFDLTSPFARNTPVMAAFRTLHQVSAYILLGLMTTHAVAALTHHFILRDDILRRMAFGRRPRASGTI